MSRPGLRDFHGKILSSTNLSEFYDTLRREFNDADLDHFHSLVKEKKPIPFTGLFANTITTEKVVPVENGFRTIKVQSIDVFGMVCKTPIVMRIDDWKPNIMVLVPIGVNPSMFAREVVADTRKRESHRNPIGDIKTEIVVMPEFSSFQYGKNRQYVKIQTESSFNAKAAADASVEAFQRCWVNVEALTNGYDDIDAPGCRALEDSRDLELHKKEKVHYPLRFSGMLSEADMVYHFMTQEDIPLVGCMLIKDYEQFDPQEYSIRYEHGVRVKYRPGAIERMQEGSFLGEVLCCSYDIETFLGRVQGHKFSDPRMLDDKIMTISMPIYRLASMLPEVSIALLPKDHPSSPSEDIAIIMCEDEKDIIRVFAQILRRAHIAILTGFNIDEFDNRYMFLRSQMYGIEAELVDSFSEYDLPGKAVFKDNEKFKMDNGKRENLHRFSSTQRATIDAYLRLAKLRPKEFQEGASLNKMLAWFGVKDPKTRKDAHKMDMPIKHMYDLWDENKPDGIREIVIYCVIDSCSTYLLLYWINFFPEMFETSNLSYTTLLDSFHRADGKRVGQLLVRYARSSGIAFCDELPPSEYRTAGVNGKIGGGDVKSLSPGLQYFIISLDYKSEYPAQKEAFNIGSSSKVSEEIIKDPERFGMAILRKDDIIDQYCSADAHWRSRERYWICSKENLTKFQSLASQENPEASESIKKRMLMTGAKDGWIYEVQQFWAEATDNDKLLQWKTYFVQSPRGPDGKITNHYSIQSKLLTDLRSERDKMKAKAKACREQKEVLTIELEKEADRVSIQVKIAKLKADIANYDSRQNAVKTLMNSEYGTGNNDRAAHFDQDVAATVTWCSRRLAEFLRRVLTCKEIIVPDYVVDKRFLSLLNTGFGKYGGLSQFGFKLSDYEGELFPDGESMRPANNAWKHPDGSVIIDPSLITERRVVKKWYTLTCPPSTITYQDTDSNYYRTLSIADYYSTCQDPVVRAKSIMHALANHNALFASVVSGLVNRWPIAVDCDGAFVTAYWSPMKKQYMGVKVPFSHEDIESKINEDLLFPKLNDRREDEAVAQFLERKQIKVTGYLIIRRETPDFVIDFLFTLLENLLALRENVNALIMTRKIMEQCEEMIKEANVEHAKKFSKQQKFRPYTKNDVRSIVERLRSENLHDLIPTEFSVTRYVLIADRTTTNEEFYARGKVAKGKKSDRMHLLTELKPGFKLDVPYYLEKMAKALANLVFEELITEEINRATDKTTVDKLAEVLHDYQKSHGNDAKEGKAKAKKAIKEASAILMNRHYAVPGTVKAHSKKFKKASEMLANMTVSTATSVHAVKQSLSVSFDRTSDIGELAEKIITTETRIALMRRKELERRAYEYANIVFLLPSEDIRRGYVSSKTEAISVNVATTHRAMIEAYASLIRAVQHIDPILSREILSHRNDGTEITFESLAGAIPVSFRTKLAVELIELDQRVRPFRDAFLDKKAFEKGLEVLANHKNK